MKKRNLTSIRQWRILFLATRGNTSGGLRKVRWNLPGKGKRGGVRIIYYWAVSQDQLLMLFMYPKNVRDDLTPVQIKILKQIVEKDYP